MSARTPSIAAATSLFTLDHKVIALVTDPALWLCIAIFLNISGITDYVPALSSLESLVFAAGLATAGLRLWMLSSEKNPSWLPLIVICGFGLLFPSLVTSLLSNHHLSILEDFGWRHFSKFVILVTACLAVSANGKLHSWLAVTLEVSFVVLAVSILYRFHILDQYNFESGRMELAGRHGDPNFACLFMTIGLVIALHKFTESHSFTAKLAHVAAAILFLVTAWFTESRAGLAILAFIALGSMCFFPFGRFRKHLFIAAPIVAIICTSLFGERILKRYMSIDDASNSGRLAGIVATFDMAAENPIIGHGHNSSSGYVSRYQDSLFASNTVALEIHTTPFQIIGELGLIGLLSYGFLYAATFTMAMRRILRTKVRPHNAVATILVLGTILMNMISIPMTYIGTVHGIVLVYLFFELKNLEPKPQQIDPA